MRPLLFAACDQGYYEKYGIALKNSAEAHGMGCLVHSSGRYSCGEQDRANHNVLRYLMLPDLLEKHPAILVLDTDCIINDKIEFPDSVDIALFLRDTQDIRKKVLGSAVYVTQRAREFVGDLRDRLSHATVWYEDQIELWKLYQKYMGQYKIKSLGVNFINWDCLPAPIWTGKGDSKRYNQTYIKRMAKYA